MIHLGKARANLPDGPVALVERVKGAVRLAMVDPTAAALGLRCGMGLADARVIVPALLVLNQDRHADAVLLDWLADGCLRYTPHVALDSPDALVLDLTGCTHLFGDEGALTADVEMRLARRGMRIRSAFAYGPEAALALARFFHRVPVADERKSVLHLPVAALGLGTEREVSLTRAGLVTIGDVARRPLAGIAARYGEEVVHAIRCMIGEADSPLAFREVESPFHFDRRFAEPIVRTDYVLERLGDLAMEAATALEARNRGGRRFEAVFFRTDGLALRLMIETGVATRDVKAILRLFRERIDSLVDPLDPGFGYDMVRLMVPVHETLAASQLCLEGGEASAMQQVDDLIDSLSTRLGRKRVRRFRPRESHIPEQAQLTLPAIEAKQLHGDWIMSAPENPPMRPLHLFNPPQRIEVLTSVPDGPPYRFRWRRRFHEVSRFEGPERIASEWWRAKDGNPAHGTPTRDYYRVEDREGRRFWIFRHGLYGDARDPGWYVHGLFA